MEARLAPIGQTRALLRRELAQEKRDGEHRRTEDLAMQKHIVRVHTAEMNLLREAFVTVHAQDGAAAVLEIVNVSELALRQLDEAVH